MADQSFSYNETKDLTANAFSKSYAVSYNANGGVSGKTGDTATAAFNGWAVSATGTRIYFDEESVTNLSAVNNGTANLWAVWGAMPSVTLPTASKEGCTFLGWYSDAELTNKVGDAGAAYTPAVDGVTLYAKYETNTYTVTFKDADGGTMDTLTVQHGDTPAAPAIPEKAPTAAQHFTGAWVPAVVPATADAVYTLTYTGADHTGGTATCLEKAACSVCGTVYGDFAAHQLTEVAAQAPSCLEPGHVAYWHCAVCEKDFIDNTGATELTAYQNGHTAAAAVKENDVPSTCMTVGSYDSVVYCSVCGTKLSSEHVAYTELDPDNHTGNNTTAREDVVPATCMDKGSYTEVVTCECGAEISRTPNKELAIDPDNHTGNNTTTQEDIVPATCMAKGSYTEVVTCECGAEISRTPNQEIAINPR